MPSMGTEQEKAKGKEQVKVIFDYATSVLLPYKDSMRKEIQPRVDPTTEVSNFLYGHRESWSRLVTRRWVGHCAA